MDTLPLVAPEQVGLSAARLDRVRTWMHQWIDSGRLAGMVAVASLGTAAMAEQVVQRTELKAAEARLSWAKRHIELVCKPFEARQMFDKATRCYDDVSRLVGDVSKPVPAIANARKVVRVARVPARIVPVRRVSRPVVVAESDPFVMPQAIQASSANRCSGISCLQRYTLLGVGF